MAEVRGAKPKSYPPEQVAEVQVLYESGLTQSEVAQEMGISQKVVWNLMRRHRIQARPAAKRDQRGAANATWRGDDASYAALHKRVEAARGRPTYCSQCGTQDPDRTYDWANLTGKYAVVADYARMCRSCHRTYDNERRKEVVPC